MHYLSRRRRHDPLLILGVVVSLLMHGGMAAAILVKRGGKRQVLEAPRDFVVAKMVRLGRKRPKNFLPVIPPRPKSTAPKQTIGLSQNENAAPSQKLPDQKRPRDAEDGKALRRAKNLAQVFAKAAGRLCE